MANIKEIERALDPQSMRFVLDRDLTTGEGYTYKAKEDTGESDMVTSLLSVEHIVKVEIADRSVLVSQDGDAQWSSLLAQVAPFIREAEPISDSLKDSKTEDSASTKKRAHLDRRPIAENLRSVIDPELGINIVDLGLIYDIRQEKDKVAVDFTATTPGCPMRRYLEQHIEGALQKSKGVDNYEVNIVWDPTWSPDMMNPNVDLFSASPSKAGIL